MLVLSLDPEGGFILQQGDVCTKIKLLETRGRKVRIGVEAPPEVRVHRGDAEPTAIAVTVAGDDFP